MPKIVKIPLIILAIILLIGLILLAVVQTSWFKNYAADKATEYLSEQLGTKVSIGEIDIDYFDRLEAHDVALYDQQEKLMIGVETLRANYDLRGILDGDVSFDKVEVDGADVHLGIRQGEKTLNLQHLINYFTPKRDTLNPSTTKQVTIFDEIELRNSSFHYFDENATSPTGRKFDETNFVFSEINGHLLDFHVINDSIAFKIDALGAKEKSGLEVKSFTSTTQISPKIFHFDELEIITDKSRIAKSLTFRQTSFADFSDFIHKVDIEADLDETVLHTDDLAYFSSTLDDYKWLIKASGLVKGRVGNLTSNYLDLNIDNHTTFRGRANVRGIPDIDNMRLNVSAKSLKTSGGAIAKLGRLDAPPKELSNLGNVNYVGTFIGSISDFKVNGLIGTDHGDLETDLHLIDPEKPSISYQGSLASSGLDLGSLTGDPKLGPARFQLELDGNGISLDAVKSSVQGSVSSVVYDNKEYVNIDVNGQLNGGSYAGYFKIDDPNYSFTVDGDIKSGESGYDLDFATNVARINLQQLGLDTLPSYLTMVGKIDIAGKDIDNLVGNLDLDSILLVRGGESYNLKNVEVESKIKGSERTIDMKSELAKLMIKGDFLPSELEQIANQVLYVINPKQYARPVDTLASHNIDVELHAESQHALVNDLVPGLEYDSLNVLINYIVDDSKLSATSRFHKLLYDGLGSPYTELKFANANINTPINYNLKTEGLFNADSVIFEKLNVHGFIKNGLLNFESIAEKDSVLDIELVGHALYKSDSLQVYLDNSKIKIFEDDWKLRKDDAARFTYHDGVAELANIDLRNGEQILFFQGSSGKVNKMNLNLLDFSLENLNPFIGSFGVTLGGITNGVIDISDRDGFPIIETDEDGILIENLMADGDTLGDLVLKSMPSQDLLKVVIDGKISNGLLNDMKLAGEINFNDKTSPLDLHLLTTKSSVKPFEKFLTGLISDIHGYSDADISISGPLANPKLDGKIILDSLDFILDYMQTRYNAFVEVDVDASAFTLTNSRLIDKNGSSAVASGNVKHKNFTDFMFNITIDQLNNFEIMNTTRKDNELFYGTAFVDGGIKILGTLDDILLEINAKSRPNTNISIPLDYFEAGGKLSYVTFVDADGDPNGVIDKFKAAAGVSMDFNFEVTNDANIVLVFDELLGDKIEAQTHGNLRMEVNTYGDFNMYGGLTVDKGSYLFTAYDIINKYFFVEPGGTLFWDGNPYNAIIDLDAVKREYPYPSALLSGADNSEDYSDPLPTDVHLILKGFLFNPNVTFDLTFPGQNEISSGNSTLSTTIDRIKTDQEEIDRQVFALLALGSFIPPSFSDGSGGDADALQATGWNSISDFASSQLNNMLSQFDLPFQVGVDWQKNSELDDQNIQQRDELITSLKYEIKRWQFSGSIDALAELGHTPYDFNVEYKLREDGNVRLKGFMKKNNNPTIGNLQTTTGVGFFYRYQFDEFFAKRKKKKARALNKPK